MLVWRKSENVLRKVLLVACALSAFACPDDDSDSPDSYAPVRAELPLGTASATMRVAARVPEGVWTLLLVSRGQLQVRSAEPRAFIADRGSACTEQGCGGTPFELFCPEGFCSFTFEVSLRRSSTEQVEFSAGMVFSEGQEYAPVGAFGCGQRGSPDFVPDAERARLFEVVVTPMEIVASPDEGTRFPRFPSEDPAFMGRDASLDATVSRSVDAGRAVFPDAAMGMDGEVGRDAALAPPEFGELVDTRDGRVYDTVRIGTQLWMAENLNFGEPRQTAKGAVADDSKVEKFCMNDDLNMCESLGGLYSWAEAHALPSECDTMECGDRLAGQRRGICPEGFRIPSNDDWWQLARHLARLPADTIVSSATWTAVLAGLKATSGWATGSAGTNASGLNVLPSGYLSPVGFAGLNELTFLAASNESGADYATGFVVRQDSVTYSAYGKDNAVSVRCVR